MTKKIIILLIISIFSITCFSQNRKISVASVEKVYNIPIYIYSYPTNEYEEKENITAIWSAISSGLNEEEESINNKVKEIVSTAKDKKKNNKVSDFDAIIINPDDYTGQLIKFANTKNNEANVKRVYGVPVYLYSYPNDEYDEVGEITATFAMLLGDGTLSENVKELVNKAKKKERKGKIGKFDAIIINPDDFMGTVIKFK